MSTTKLPTTQAGAYLVKGTIGNAGTPGAPIAHFTLVVVPGANSVSGTMEITQATASGNTVVPQVTGTIRATGYGKVTKVVALEGDYQQVQSPPAGGTIEQSFSAHMAIDDAWNGTGGFTYGGQDVENVPVTKS